MPGGEAQGGRERNTGRGARGLEALGRNYYLWYAKELLLMILDIVHDVAARSCTCQRRCHDMARDGTCGTTELVLENTVKYPNTYNLYMYPHTGTNIKYRRGTGV